MPNNLANLKNKFKSLLFPKFPSHAGEYQTSKVRTNGIMLNFVKIGHGPPLVFIHGWTNNWEGWIPIVKYLKDDYTLYLIDMPGFGNSGNLPHYSVEINATHIAKFIKTLPEKAKGVIGISMGSFVAADVAFRYQKSVNSAILTGPVIDDGRYRHFPSAFNLFLRTVQKSQLTQAAIKRIIETRAAAYLLAKYFNMYRWKREIVDLYGMVGKKLIRKEAYIEMGVSASKYDLKGTLKKISIPTLIVLGKEDKYTSYKFVEKNLLPTNRNLSLSVIPLAGHCVPWDKPKEVAEEIKRFLDSTKNP